MSAVYRGIGKIRDERSVHVFLYLPVSVYLQFKQTTIHMFLYLPVSVYLQFKQLVVSSHLSPVRFKWTPVLKFWVVYYVSKLILIYCNDISLADKIVLCNILYIHIEHLFK